MNNNEKQSINQITEQIKKLIRMKRFDEVYKLTEKYPDNSKLQSQKIKVLIMQGKTAEAKRIGDREIFRDDEFIQSQMLSIAIKENDRKRTIWQ